MSKSLRRCRCLFLVAFVILLAGCPSYSHLREAPDYKNMNDSAGEVDRE